MAEIFQVVLNISILVFMVGNLAGMGLELAKPRKVVALFGARPV